MIEYSLIALAYLLGSLSSAIIICRLAGLPDPRTQGSGNPGATNVLRFGGRKTAAIVLFGDLLKGLVPVLAAQLLGLPIPLVGLTALAAFMGHLYPVFFRFRGGKGVATFIGVLIGIHWGLGLAAIASWLLLATTIKISSLSALTMSLLVPVYGWFILRDWPLTAILGLMVVMIFWRHRGNIKRLIQGSEGRIAGGNDPGNAADSGKAPSD